MSTNYNRNHMHAHPEINNRDGQLKLAQQQIEQLSMEKLALQAQLAQLQRKTELPQSDSSNNDSALFLNKIQQRVGTQNSTCIPANTSTRATVSTHPLQTHSSLSSSSTCAYNQSPPFSSEYQYPCYTAQSQQLNRQSTESIRQPMTHQQQQFLQHSANVISAIASSSSLANQKLPKHSTKSIASKQVTHSTRIETLPDKLHNPDSYNSLTNNKRNQARVRQDYFPQQAQKGNSSHSMCCGNQSSNNSSSISSSNSSDSENNNKHHQNRKNFNVMNESVESVDTTDIYQKHRTHRSKRQQQSPDQICKQCSRDQKGRNTTSTRNNSQQKKASSIHSNNKSNNLSRNNNNDSVNNQNDQQPLNEMIAYLQDLLITQQQNQQLLLQQQQHQLQQQYQQYPLSSSSRLQTNSQSLPPQLYSSHPLNNASNNYFNQNGLMIGLAHNKNNPRASSNANIYMQNQTLMESQYPMNNTMARLNSYETDIAGLEQKLAGLRSKISAVNSNQMFNNNPAKNINFKPTSHSLNQHPSKISNLGAILAEVISNRSSNDQNPFQNHYAQQQQQQQQLNQQLTSRIPLLSPLQPVNQINGMIDTFSPSLHSTNQPFLQQQSQYQYQQFQQQPTHLQYQQPIQQQQLSNQNISQEQLLQLLAQQQQQLRNQSQNEIQNQQQIQLKQTQRYPSADFVNGTIPVSAAQLSNGNTFQQTQPNSIESAYGFPLAKQEQRQLQQLQPNQMYVGQTTPLVQAALMQSINQPFMGGNQQFGQLAATPSQDFLSLRNSVNQPLPSNVAGFQNIVGIQNEFAAPFPLNHQQFNQNQQNIYPEQIIQQNANLFEQPNAEIQRENGVYHPAEQLQNNGLNRQIQNTVAFDSYGNPISIPQINQQNQSQKGWENKTGANSSNIGSVRSSNCDINGNQIIGGNNCNIGSTIQITYDQNGNQITGGNSGNMESAIQSTCDINGIRGNNGNIILNSCDPNNTNTKRIMNNCTPNTEQARIMELSEDPILENSRSQSNHVKENLSQSNPLRKTIGYEILSNNQNQVVQLPEPTCFHSKSNSIGIEQSQQDYPIPNSRDYRIISPNKFQQQQVQIPVNDNADITTSAPNNQLNNNWNENANSNNDNNMNKMTNENNPNDEQFNSLKRKETPSENANFTQMQSEQPIISNQNSNRQEEKLTLKPNSPDDEVMYADSFVSVTALPKESPLPSHFLPQVNTFSSVDGSFNKRKNSHDSEKREEDKKANQFQSLEPNQPNQEFLKQQELNSKESQPLNSQQQQQQLQQQQQQLQQLQQQQQQQQQLQQQQYPSYEDCSTMNWEQNGNRVDIDSTEAAPINELRLSDFNGSPRIPNKSRFSIQQNQADNQTQSPNSFNRRSNEVSSSQFNTRKSLDINRSQQYKVTSDYMKVTENRCNYVRNVHQEYVRRSSSMTPKSARRTPNDQVVQTPKAAAAAAAAAATSHQEPLHWEKVLSEFVKGADSSTNTTNNNNNNNNMNNSQHINETVNPDSQQITFATGLQQQQQQKQHPRSQFGRNSALFQQNQENKIPNKNIPSNPNENEGLNESRSGQKSQQKLQNYRETSSSETSMSNLQSPQQSQLPTYENLPNSQQTPAVVVAAFENSPLKQQKQPSIQEINIPQRVSQHTTASKFLDQQVREEMVVSESNQRPVEEPAVKLVQIRQDNLLLSNPPDFEDTLQAELDIFTKEIEAKKAALLSAQKVQQQQQQQQQMASALALKTNNQQQQQPKQRKNNMQQSALNQQTPSAKKAVTSQSPSFTVAANQSAVAMTTSSNITVKTRQPNPLRLSQDQGGLLKDGSISQINLQNQSMEELSELGITESELIQQATLTNNNPSVRNVNSSMRKSLTENGNQNANGGLLKQQQQGVGNSSGQNTNSNWQSAKKATYAQIKQRRDDQRIAMDSPRNLGQSPRLTASGTMRKSSTFTPAAQNAGDSFVRDSRTPRSKAQQTPQQQQEQPMKSSRQLTYNQIPSIAPQQIS